MFFYFRKGAVVLIHFYVLLVLGVKEIRCQTRIDTFDDVIDTAVAIGTIGRGTASLALRGGVDA